MRCEPQDGRGLGPARPRRAVQSLRRRSRRSNGVDHLARGFFFESLLAARPPAASYLWGWPLGLEPMFQALGPPGSARSKKTLGRFCQERYTQSGFRVHPDKPVPFRERGRQVFERFTERARRVIILAREEAGRFR